MRRHERVTSWLVCGPLGHFVAGVADFSSAFAKYWVARARGLEPFSER